MNINLSSVYSKPLVRIMLTAQVFLIVWCDSFDSVKNRYLEIFYTSQNTFITLSRCDNILLIFNYSKGFDIFKLFLILIWFYVDIIYWHIINSWILKNLIWGSLLVVLCGTQSINHTLKLKNIIQFDDIMNVSYKKIRLKSLNKNN